MSHVVVTGGRGALGEVVVATLTQRGATVHVPPREVRLDDEAATVAYFASLPSPLRGSVHLVGGFAMKPIVETSLADFEAQHRVNAVTCFLACREAVRQMRRGGQGGRIVNISSIGVDAPFPGATAYLAAKGAIAAFSSALASEVASERISVELIKPGVIDTAANRTAMPDADRSGWIRPLDLAARIADFVLS